ncbi:MAG: hypothetical protein QW735_04485 [archaeon]
MIVYKNINELKEMEEIKEIKNKIKPIKNNDEILEFSLRTEGFNPGISKILIDTENRIIDGYKRYEICKKLRISEVPVEIYTIYSETEVENQIKKLEYQKLHLLRNANKYDNFEINSLLVEILNQIKTLKNKLKIRYKTETVEKFEEEIEEVKEI